MGTEASTATGGKQTKKRAALAYKWGHERATRPVRNKQMYEQSKRTIGNTSERLSVSILDEFDLFRFDWQGFKLVSFYCVWSNETYV